MGKILQGIYLSKFSFVNEFTVVKKSEIESYF